MAKATKCDRCGTYHDGLLYHFLIEDQTVMFGEDDDAHYDICQRCKNEFDKFVKGKEIKPLRVKE